MTDQGEDQINDPHYALKVWVGAAARWMRDERLYPDASFLAFLQRIGKPWGWDTEQIVDAIGLADLVIPEPGDSAANWATLRRCYEVVTGQPLIAAPSPFEPPPDL
jgi:hypothetical protein